MAHLDSLHCTQHRDEDYWNALRVFVCGPVRHLEMDVDGEKRRHWLFSCHFWAFSLWYIYAQLHILVHQIVWDPWRLVGIGNLARMYVHVHTIPVVNCMCKCACEHWVVDCMYAYVHCACWSPVCMCMCTSPSCWSPLTAPRVVLQLDGFTASATSLLFLPLTFTFQP